MNQSASQKAVSALRVRIGLAQNGPIHLPLSKGRISAPEEHRQENHEEGMGAEVGRDGEVAVQGWGAQLVLHPGQVGRLPADQGQRSLALVIPPPGQRPLVCSRISNTSQSPPAVYWPSAQ